MSSADGDGGTAGRLRQMKKVEKALIPAIPVRTSS